MSALTKSRTVGGWVIHVPIAGLMIYAGWPKVFGSAAQDFAEVLQRYGLAEQIKLIGAGELLTAVLLLFPYTCSLGVLLASAFWGGAICLHMSHGDPYLFQSVLLVLTWVGAFLRNPLIFSSFPGIVPGEKKV
jgi:hypothetical protein